jgi:molybdate transport system ATP-binding protein
MAAAFGKAGGSMKLHCRIPLANFELNIDATFDARVTSFFGPSGSGKTTLLDAIAGLRNISEGEIGIDGRTLFSSAKRINLPPQQRGIGYVPQEGALFPHLSVRKNILFGAARHTAGQVHHMSADHVAEVLDIANLLPRAVTSLSGGEAQRVALARAIVSQPKLLLLDEPLAALDIGLKEKILPYLARVRDEFAIPMIYVTHNLTEVLTLADWVLMIRDGKLIGQGNPKETLHSVGALSQISEDRYENVFAAAVVESNRDAGATRVRLPSGDELFIPYTPAPANSALQIGVSADDILIATEAPRGISARNVMAGEVRHIERADGEAMLTVYSGVEFFVSLTAAAVERLGLKAGTAVFLIIKTRSFRLL